MYSKTQNAWRLLLERLEALEALRVDVDDLARLDLADERRAEVVEGAALGRGDPAAIDAAEAERPVAHRVARHHHRVRRDDGERVGAVELAA